MMFRSFLIILTISYASPSNAEANLSKAYVIKPNVLSEGVIVIRPGQTPPEDQKAQVLRDPTLQKQDLHSVTAKKAKIHEVKIIQRVLVSKPARLAFKVQKVSGSVRQPRVKFQLDRVPVGRRDEPIRADFFNKTLEDLNNFEE